MVSAGKFSTRIGPILGLILLLAAGFGGCSSPPPEPPPPLRIGLNVALSSDLAPYGRQTRDTARLWLELTEKTGGLKIGGRATEIRLIIKDNQGRLEKAVEVARELINKHHVSAIIGPNISSLAIPAAKVCEEAGVIMVSPVSTHPETTRNKKHVFRAIFIDPFQGRVMANFARGQLNRTTAAVLYDVASAYNRDIAKVFMSVFKGQGGQVVAEEIYTTDANQDFTAQLRRIKAAEPELLFLPNYEADVHLQVRQARELGIEAVLLGSDGWNLEAIVGRPEYNGAYFSTSWHPEVSNLQAEMFIEAFHDKYNLIPGAVAACTYDSLGLVLAAVRAGQSTAPAAIREGIYGLDRYQGVTGPIEYSATGDPQKSAVIVRVVDGRPKFHDLVGPK